MKRNLILFLLTLPAMLAGEARSLTPAEALARLEAPGAAPSRIRRAIASAPDAHLAATDSLNAAYYLFDSSDNTLIVSADDCAPALLGYLPGTKTSVASMPPQMRLWLDEYSRQIAWARTNSPEAMVADAAEPTKREAIEAMCTTAWSQDSPYNIYCPTKNGRTTYTGCVATAMAQIMRYHSYPDCGSGNASYAWNGVELAADFGSYPLDWQNMPGQLGSGSSDTEKDAVGRLMQLCGYAVEMRYGLDNDGGSGAPDTSTPGAFIEHFGYSPSLHIEFRDYYDADTWADMVYESLATAGPVFYGGVTGSGGGHAFVCDGYDGQGYFHINWGWGGDYDGYFLLSALKPDGQGIGGSAGGYNFRQDAVLGIRRPFEGEVAALPYMALNQSMSCTVSGRLVRFGGGFYNLSGRTGHFTIRMMVECPDGSTVYSETKLEDDVPTTFGASVMDFTFPAGLPEGVHRIRPVYCLDNDERWTEFKTPLSTASSFNVTLSGGRLRLGGDFEASSGTTLTASESDAPVHYYSPAGIEIKAGQLVPGIYIRVQGSSRRPVLVGAN